MLTDRDEMSNLHTGHSIDASYKSDWDKMSRGPSIDASYQVSAHLAEGFQRRRLKCEKLTDDR